MPGKASRLAHLALLLPLAAMPAAAQAQVRAPAECRTTLAYQDGGDAEAAGPSDPSCSAPRETRMYGGWLAHAIMLVDLSPGRSLLRPIRVSATNGLERRAGTDLTADRRRLPIFTVPPALR